VANDNGGGGHVSFYRKSPGKEKGEVSLGNLARKLPALTAFCSESAVTWTLARSVPRETRGAVSARYARTQSQNLNRGLAIRQLVARIVFTYGNKIHLFLFFFSECPSVSSIRRLSA
jgi:hypothetical protein